jgi:hypothetical protein
VVPLLVALPVCEVAGRVVAVALPLCDVAGRVETFPDLFPTCVDAGLVDAFPAVLKFPFLIFVFTVFEVFLLLL